MRPKASNRAWIWLAALASGVALAREADIPALRAWDLPNFTLIAEDGFAPDYFVKRMADAERVAAKLLARQPHPDSVPMTVWLVPGGTWDRYLSPGETIVGEFVPRRFANYLLVDADMPHALVRKAVQHEYTHWFLHTQVGGILPLWFDEGFAGIVGNSKMGATRVTFEPPASPNLFGWVPMARLFELDKTSREYRESPSSYFVHLESYALVHRGLIGETPFGDRMFEYLSAVNRLVPPEEAAPRAFGLSFEDLDVELRGYMVQPRTAVGTMPIERAASVKLPEGRRLAPDEAATRLAAVALDTGFMPENAHELVRAAANIAPDSAASSVLELRLAVRDGRDADALKIGTMFATATDVRALRDAGLGLFERVREEGAGPTGDTREHVEDLAFSLLDRALTLDAGDAGAAWGYAMLAARQHQHLESALERLATARARMPGHPDLAQATALALEASGQEDAMMPYLTEALRNTSSPEQRAWAARRIRELRASETEKAAQ